MIQKYHISLRVIHWLMALIIISLLASGIYMTTLTNQPFRPTFYNLHKSFGVIVIFLFTLRIISKIKHKAPKLPKTINRNIQKLAHGTHHLIYLLMITIPLSGYLMSNSYGYAVKLFGTKLPNLVEKNYQLAGLFSNIHQYAAYFLIFLLILHIGAVIKHRFFEAKENDILPRML